jgi:sec-independent protein translocase protein TatA
MFSQLRGWEWLIIVALILLLFGAKRLPDAARGLGRSLRIFKAETKGLVDGDSSTATPEAIAPAADQPAPPAAAVKPEAERAEG